MFARTQEFHHPALGLIVVANSAEPDLSMSRSALIGQLFIAQLDAVYNVAYRVLWSKADAEDVIQATFLKAYTRIEQLEDHDRARPWLLQIAYREAVNILRQRRDLPTDPAELPDSSTHEPGPEAIAVSLSVAKQIAAALDGLAQDERMAVVLRDVEELPMSEVAEVLGIGLSAAKMRVHRGRAELRRVLGAQEVRS